MAPETLLPELIAFPLPQPSVRPTPAGHIELSLPKRVVQLPPEEAFTLGMRLVVLAQHAMPENFLRDWCGASGWTSESTEQLLDAYRDWLLKGAT